MGWRDSGPIDFLDCFETTFLPSPARARTPPTGQIVNDWPIFDHAMVLCASGSSTDDSDRLVAQCLLIIFHGRPMSAAKTQETVMLYYAAVFFIIAVIAAVFGFTGIAAGAAGIAKILFFIFLVLFVASLIMGALRRP
jgi:uncharacterized membrane protein YtjA (UPF0391 family)